MSAPSVWGALVLWGAAVTLCGAHCPLVWEGGRLTAQCGSTGLTALPDDLDSALQALDLSHNNLTSLNRDAFTNIGLVNLQRLNLSACHLSDIHERAFHSLELLHTLDLSHNSLTTLTPRWFHETPRLRHLLFGGNRITRLADDTFSTLTRLQLLELNDCELVEVAPRAFAGLETSLRRLDLGGNKLRTVEAASVTTLQSLRHLELTGNSWECTCGVRALLQWARREHVVTGGAPSCEAGSPTTCQVAPATPTAAPVTLECRVSGVPADALHWSRGGMPLEAQGGAPVTLQTDAPTNSFTLRWSAPHTPLELALH